MNLFLDIEGVLCSSFFSGRNCSRRCQTERFEAIMRDFPLWKIVISSGLRERKSLQDFREMFSADIEERIVGVTPVIGLTIKRARQREIERYLGNTHQTSSLPWIALDDMVSEFDEGLENLVLCNFEVGLDDFSEALLREKLAAGERHHFVVPNDPPRLETYRSPLSGPGLT